MKPNEYICIEKFRKVIGGKYYRIVRIKVRGALVIVGDFLTDTDEEAVEKTLKALKNASEIALEFINEKK